jgi:hypothetical protein
MAPEEDKKHDRLINFLLLISITINVLFIITWFGITDTRDRVKSMDAKVDKVIELMQKNYR